MPENTWGCQSMHEDFPSPDIPSHVFPSPVIPSPLLKKVGEEEKGTNKGLWPRGTSSHVVKNIYYYTQRVTTTMPGTPIIKILLPAL